MKGLKIQKFESASSPVGVDETPRGFIFKFILIGDAGVGKTSILQRYTENRFESDYHVTVGAEFGSKFVDIDEYTRIKLQIWDTAGQDSFINIVRSFYNGSQAVFLVYNVNRRDTFESLYKWKNDVAENVDANAIFVLMGNQVDLDNRQVSYDEGVKFMQDNNIHFFFETSALTGANVDLAFDEAAKLCFISYLKEKMGPNNSVSEYRRDRDDTVSLAPTPKKSLQRAPEGQDGGCAC